MENVRLTLPQELVLLATAESSGKKLASSQTLKFTVSGALLAELAIQESVTVTKGKVSSTGTMPSAYVAQYQQIADSRAAKAKTWVTRFAHRNAWDNVSEELVARHILSKEASRFLGIARYPVLDPTVEARLRGTVQAALDGGPVAERTAALIGLAQASGLIRKLFPDADRRRVASIIEGQWASKAAKAAVDAMNAAIMSAVMVSSTTAATSASS